MEMVPLTHERKAQLEEYAQRHGIDPASALDELLAEAFESERQDYDETVDATLEAYESVKAGRTQSAAEFLRELRKGNVLPEGVTIRDLMEEGRD